MNKEKLQNKTDFINKGLIALTLVVCIVSILLLFFMPHSNAAATVKILGDADLDDTISASDARLTLRFAVNIEKPSDAQFEQCDVDEDGLITATDARSILRAAVYLEELGCNSVKKTDDMEEEQEEIQVTTNPIDANVNDEDVENLAIVVCQEAGGMSEEIQLLVANVVLNRVNSPYFPNTVYEVLTQRWQYERVTREGGIYWPNWADTQTKDQCRSVAYRILSGERVCPSNVVYQAGFEQGSGIYKFYETPSWLDNFYFCYM